MIRGIACFVAFAVCSNVISADDSTAKIREGMRLYAAEQFEEAGKSFASATESLEKAKSNKSAIAAFDEACALHRKGDLELARERYLKAGLSQDKTIAASAHFNLGVIASEQARKEAGETPESVPEEKRKEILNELSRSIDAYRHCLELQPTHGPARRNLELLRQWIKYHTDKWREADLKKRRDETNLIQFLEYLVQTQLSLKETAEGFRSNTAPNAFAELKRLQDELSEEIAYLKDKIDSELRPKDENPKNATASSLSTSSENNQEVEQGIALLSDWADKARAKMDAAGKALMKRDIAKAIDNQQRAADQLDQIWDAVVPFHHLLGKELFSQTQIAKQISPSSATASTKGDKGSEEDQEDLQSSVTTDPQQKLEVEDLDWNQLAEQQNRTLRKARLLTPKAEAELDQVASIPAQKDEPNVDQLSAVDPSSVDPSSVADKATGAPKVDPEAIKAGYQNALELAPQAVAEMESAVKQLEKRDRTQSAKHAEEARRILQEIADAQPKNPEKDQNDQNQDQNKNDKEQDSEQKKDKEKENKDESKDSKDDQEKSDEQQQEKKQQKDENENSEDNKDKSSDQRLEPKVSQDRIEEALRRVREREKENRERVRELRARVLGRVPVDKDW